jgi:hypothetical protein
MALYALALGYSNGIAPLITGFINDGLGYKWVFVSIQFHRPAFDQMFITQPLLLSTGVLSSAE